jgi:hypothetical protein
MRLTAVTAWNLPETVNIAKPICHASNAAGNRVYIAIPFITNDFICATVAAVLAIKRCDLFGRFWSR